jgi:hypothetical protein
MYDPLPLDVMARLNEDFGDRANAVAQLLLTRRRIGSADRISDRLLRCIVHAALGDEQRVKQLLDARQDYRDVIMVGEYNMAGRRIRDLHATFLIDSPEKFWISDVTGMMASHGYRLMSLETRAATTGPFEYTADYSEGTATFTGPKGNIEIEKKDRNWTIRGNSHELEIHELNHPFENERAFCDVVSGFLLSNNRPNARNESNEVNTTRSPRRSWWQFWK